MTDEGKQDTGDGGLYIDSDWKEEAAREKQRLAEEEAQQQAAQGGEGEGPQVAVTMFLELVNMLAMQAMVGLGGYKGPGGESIPPNPEAARHYIDMLGCLEEKTQGHLTNDEAMILGRVLQDLRMTFVQVAGPGKMNMDAGGEGQPPQAPAE
ncbi:MAG: DUF1844 domain-containing protein [Planctomycetota bacterium]|jgi:hypothetical protein